MEVSGLIKFSKRAAPVLSLANPLVTPAMRPLQMEFQGIRRKIHVPHSSPPETSPPRRGRGGAKTEVPVFEPYEESLPLQSGFYSYVIDRAGRFRVKWGNTQSHAGMVGGQRVAAAGRFQVNRMGRVFHVVCGCTDYRFFYQDNKSPRVVYTIAAFRDHPAFSLSPEAVFQFHTGVTDKFFVSAAGEPIAEPFERLVRLENEGTGQETSSPFTAGQIERFRRYAPSPPSMLYGMRIDQVVTSLEEFGDDPVDYGPAAPHLTPESAPLPSGKINFVLDPEGWLIVGAIGHQLLSGGHHVGGAGHLHVEATGEITGIDLNFSGHYRPPLTADHARFVYRSVSAHPLLTIAPACRFSGRMFDEDEMRSTVIQFARAELESDDPELDRLLETYTF